MNRMHYFNIFRNFSEEHGKLFESLIQLTKAKTIVEIGVAYGTTTKFLCSGCLENGGTVYGFDVWEQHGEQLQYQPLSTKEDTENYLKSENINNFTLTKIDTKSDSFKEELNKLPSLDFVFIDGDHSYEGVKKDFESIYPHLSDFSIVAFHDTLRIDGCREFMIDLRTKFNDGSFDIIDIPFGNGSRRTGISFLFKRSFHSVDIKIDEICGSPSDPESIYKKENEYIKEKIEKK